jgi:hypothetical protein
MTIVRQVMRWLRGDSPSTGWQRWGVLGFGIVLMILSVEGFVFRDPYEPAPRDIDASVKRAQALGLAESAFLKQALPYRARYLDPKQWYLPFVKPFVIRTRTGMQSIFPTVAAAIDVPAEQIGGMAALRVVSIGSMLLAVLLALRFLRGGADAMTPAVVLLATPLWFYALGGTSHPAGLVLAMAALLVSCSQERALTAGLLLGLASTIRDEALALAPGLLALMAWQWRKPWPLVRLAVGVGIPVAVVGLIDQHLYGRPAAAHLLHALQGSFFSDSPTGPMEVLQSMTWRERLGTVLVYWIDGHSLTHVAIVSAAVAFALAVRHRTGSFWGAVPALGIVLVDTGTDLVAMLGAPRRVPGLLRLAPFLLFAVLPHAEAPPDQGRRRLSALVLSAVFVLVAVMTTNTSGGKPLGPRLLLPVWLLLSVVAWQSIRGHASAGSRALSHKILAAGGAVLVIAGFIINAVLLMPLYRVAEADALDATRFLAQAADEVVVIGSPFAIDPVIGVYPSKSVMLASSDEDVRDIAERLERARIRQFRFVRRNDRDDLAADFPAYSMSDQSIFGRWVVQRWTLTLR